MREFEKVIDIYKDYLPDKAKKFGFPHILWIAPPNHKNFGSSNNSKRRNQTEALLGNVDRFKFMSALKLIKVWDPKDSNNYLYESDRFTSSGLTNYWKSVDSAIRFWNVAVLAKLQKQISI